MTTQEKEQKLKLALARMLPQHIKVFKPVTQQPCWFEWNDDKPFGRQIKDTEWLYICWLIEQEIIKDAEKYMDHCCLLLRNSGEISAVSLSWQQRAEAICKVRGVEI